MDVHTRIVAAAIDRIAAAGYDGLSISAVSRLSGVSRPTIYAHFGSLEQLAAEALEVAAVRVISRVVERAREAGSAADYVVEVMVAARAEFRSQPALAPIAFPQRGSILFDGDPIGPGALELSRSFLLPLLEFDPELEPELDEISETTLRFLISLVMFESSTSRSDDKLRAYLHRRLVPALGVTS
ncbi:TetR/AcrR family transcriptional regulator [Saccharopolyspora griseoalba]|uniref:TetR/AcrR family transcriptional regulator n=1 Tax=Saccharopolyspora griseoalba TaxID=1431848 RepID=A0ABW2LNF5_9PSEU